MNDLEDRLLQAHAAGDRPALIAVYAAAADATQDVNAACFFLTQAYVFALEAGDPAVEALAKRLADHGREPAPRTPILGEAV